MTGVIHFGLVNYADIGTLSGGSWETALPKTNLQARPLSRVARSTDALAASTRIDIDLADDSRVIRLVGLLKHNCSIDATYQITGGTSSGASDVYDSGELPVWPAVFLPGDLEWEDDNWWTGQISQADAAIYPIHLLHDAGANYRARYWRLQITDTTNADGYVQAGRLWMGPLVYPTHGYQFGANLVWDPRSESEASLGGVLFFDERPSVRVMQFSLGALSNLEGWGTAIDSQRIARTDREIIIIPDPDDAQRAHKRNVYGRFRRFDPLTQIANDLQTVGYEVEELL